MWIIVLACWQMLLLTSFALSQHKGNGEGCGLDPVGLTVPKSNEDLARYRIEISGNLEAYVPGEQYTVLLKGVQREDTAYKFIRFILAIQHSETGNSNNASLGSLQLYGDSLTKFNNGCRDSIVETDTQPKGEIQVLWIAPPPGSGCVTFKASVVESSDLWFSEDGALTKVLCQVSEDSDNLQPLVLPQCCACDEAKYEVTFEGLWSRNTHPKDFPSNG